MKLLSTLSLGVALTILLCHTPYPATAESNATAIPPEYLKLAGIGPKMLAKERGLCAKDGIVLDAVKLHSDPMPSDDQNAGQDYIDLQKLIAQHPLSLTNDELTLHFTKAPGGFSEKVRKILADRPELVQLVEQAAPKPDCVIEKDWTQGPNILFKELTGMRLAARILCLQAYLLASDGHYTEAIAKQNQVFHIAAEAGNDTLINYFVNIACYATGLRGLMHIATLSHGDPSVAKQIENVIKANKITVNFSVAMSSELATITTWIDSLRKNGNPIGVFYTKISDTPDDFVVPGFILPKKKRQILSDYFDGQEAIYLRESRQMIECSRLPYRQSHDLLLKEDARLSQLHAASKDHPELGQLFLFFLLPGTKNAESTQSLIARRAVMLESMQLLEQGKSGKVWPAHLSGLALDSLTDGKSLQYRREGNGFVIYSVGLTGHFNGGKPGDPLKGSEDYFRFPM